MSRRGEIVVECDLVDCYAEIVFTSSQLDIELPGLLIDAGWERTRDRDICPDCVKAAQDEARSADAHERAAARCPQQRFCRHGRKEIGHEHGSHVD